jgi:hypothetical protein
MEVKRGPGGGHRAPVDGPVRQEEVRPRSDIKYSY